MADLIRNDGTYARRDEDKVEVLNAHYAKTFTVEDLTDIPVPNPRELQSHLHIVVSRNKVLKLLKALRVDKSPGPDGIHPRILRELAVTLATPLQILFSASLTRGEVPTQWREATVVPIYKKGDKADPGNYRPVSLTSVICKTLERLIAEETVEHLRTNALTAPPTAWFHHRKIYGNQLTGSHGRVDGGPEP